MLVLIKLNEMYNEYEGREVGNKLTVMRYKLRNLGMNSRGFACLIKFFFTEYNFKSLDPSLIVLKPIKSLNTL